MPFARPRLTRPLPRQAPRRTPWRAARETALPGSTVAAQLDGGNFAGRVYVAWDPPTAANPAWIEVTQFVQKDPGIVITRGRPDGESDPQVGTATMTVDNTDGRWVPKNANGAWFGQIRKGCWLRVDVLPPSGIVSTRFTGFVQQLPAKWAGRTSMVPISASDRFVLLGNAPKPLGTAIFGELTSDPAGAPYITGYWPLHEPAGAAYVSDASGQAAQAQSTLTVRSLGVNPGTGITFSNTPAPGYDGASTVSFAPSGTPIPAVGGGNTGALPYGSYLIGATQPSGNVYDIGMWINATVANEPIFSWSDPTLNYAFGAALTQSGQLAIWQCPLSGSSSAINNTVIAPLGQYPLNDGVWHQFTMRLQTAAGTPNGGGSGFLAVYIDGIQTAGEFLTGTLATTLWPQPTLSRLLVGGAEGWNGDTSNTAICLFTGSISDLVIHQGLAWNTIPDTYGPYQAGTSMWQGPNSAYSVPESCGRRVVRLASYSGLPTPLTSFTSPGESTPTYDVACGVSPFVNIPAETAHPAGFQQTDGSQPLAAMQVAAHTENMPLFIDRQDRITLQPSTLRQNPVPAFSIHALDLDPSTEWADDFQYLQNQTVVTPSGQGALTVNTNGLASQALNGQFSNGVDSITINALESGSLGAAINAAGADPQPRHNPLACEVATLATQSAPPLTANPNFAANVAGWAANGGTITWSNAVLYPGQTGSGLITPDGTSAQDTAETTPFSIIPGQPYTVQGWVYSPVGHPAGISINWYAADNYAGYISTGSGGAAIVALPVGQWTFITGSFTAPANANFATALAIQQSTPPTSAKLYLSQVAFYDESSIYGTAWYDAVLAADISTVIQVANWPAQSPGGTVGSYYIEGYTETITAANHLFAWNTSPAQGPTYQLDSPTLGLLDTPGITLAY